MILMKRHKEVKSNISQKKIVYYIILILRAGHEKITKQIRIIWCC